MKYKKYILISLNFNSSFVFYYTEDNIKTPSLDATSLYKWLHEDDKSNMIMVFYHSSIEELESSLQFKGRQLLLTSDDIKDILDELQKYCIIEELGK